MQRTFPTIHDYHRRAPDLSVEASEWARMRTAVLIEGSGDVCFARTERHALVMTLDGTRRHLTRMDGIDDETPSRPGEICLVPEGVELHLAWTNRDTLQKTVVVEFHADLFSVYVPEVMTDAFQRGHLLPSNFAPRPGLEPLMRLLAREVGPVSSAGPAQGPAQGQGLGQGPGQARGRLFADTLIRLLSLELAVGCWSVPARVPAGPQGGDARVHRAIDYIETHHAEDISLPEIAAAAGLSPTHLTDVFRRATGVTPYSYVINRRLRQAVHLLRSTDLPIAQVALEAGFADQQHLTRMMQARLRQTPKEVRQD